jgi:hypothetical protein
VFSDFVKRYDGKCLVSTVEGNSIDIFTTRDIGNELALLEVTFKGNTIDIQKNLTQYEKKKVVLKNITKVLYCFPAFAMTSYCIVQF